MPSFEKEFRSLKDLSEKFVVSDAKPRFKDIGDITDYIKDVLSDKAADNPKPEVDVNSEAYKAGQELASKVFRDIEAAMPKKRCPYCGHEMNDNA